MTNKIVVFDVAEIEKINDIDELDDDVSPSRTRSGSRSARTRDLAAATVRAFEVDLDQFNANLLGFIDNVRAMLGKMSEAAGNFSVEQVEVQAQINGEGKVGFLGSGVKASGGASIKIVFERRKDQEPAVDPS